MDNNIQFPTGILPKVLPSGRKIARYAYLADGIYFAVDNNYHDYYIVSRKKAEKLSETAMKFAKMKGESICFIAADFSILLIELEDELWHIWRTSPNICRHEIFMYTFTTPEYFAERGIDFRANWCPPFYKYIELECEKEDCAFNREAGCTKTSIYIDSSGICAEISDPRDWD